MFGRGGSTGPRWVAGALLLLASVTLAGAAQEKEAEDHLNEGLRRLAAEEYEAAIRALRKATEVAPENGQTWGNLGLALQAAGRFEEAAAAYKEVLDDESLAGIAQYNLACVYSVMNEKDQAFHWLDRVLEAGFRNVARLESDPDLDNIRDDPRFAEALRRADIQRTPCQKDERYRQLDFWLGRWKVRGENGLAGYNHIVATLEGCLIYETWVAAGGRGRGRGNSMNYFDPELGKWRQNWVASKGYVIDYVGEFRDGAMRFEGRNTSAAGNTELSRMTLTPQPDGTVLQSIVQSKDEGQTWYTWFEGVYEPYEAAAAESGPGG